MKRQPLVLVILLLGLALPTRQTVEGQYPARSHPLLALLALTPDAPFTSRGAPFLRYTDYQALRALPAPDAACPPRKGSADADEQTEGGWFRRPAATQSGSGFSPLAVERALAFGEPPDSGVILEGNFDVMAVTAALGARGYVQRDEQGILIAQPPVGPQREQIALAGRYLMTTPKATLLDDLVNAYIGYQQSLYSDSRVLALAEALAYQPGVLLRAAFFTTGTLPPGLPASLVSLFERHPGELLALAEYQSGGERLTLLALVAGDRSQARLAARALVRRLRDGGAMVQAPIVYQGAGGYFVALARARRADRAGLHMCAL